MIDCSKTENYFAEKQRMTKKHKKTYLTELLEKYPNALIGDDGTPEGLCPHYLGLKDNIDACKKGYNCAECWNQPIEDGEE